MMDTVSASQARREFARLLERAKRGQRITITRRGVPVAMLAPLGNPSGRSTREVVAELKEVREGLSLGGSITIRELIEDGRKY